MLTTILIILLILALVGGLPVWQHQPGTWAAWSPGAVIIVVLLVLLLTGGGLR